MESTAESSRQTITPSQQPPITAVTEIIIDDGNSATVVDNVIEVDQKETLSPAQIDVEENTASSTKPNQSKSTEIAKDNLISSTNPDHSKSTQVTTDQESLKTTDAEDDIKNNKDDSENITTSSPENEAVVGHDITNVAVDENIENKNDEEKVAVEVVGQSTLTEKDTNIATEVSNEIKVDGNDARHNSLSENNKLADQKQQPQQPIEKATSQSSKRNRNLRPDASADLNMQWYDTVLPFFLSFSSFSYLLSFAVLLGKISFKRQMVFHLSLINFP